MTVTLLGECCIPGAPGPNGECAHTRAFGAEPASALLNEEREHGHGDSAQPGRGTSWTCANRVAGSVRWACRAVDRARIKSPSSSAKRPTSSPRDLRAGDHRGSAGGGASCTAMPTRPASWPLRLPAGRVPSSVALRRAWCLGGAAASRDRRATSPTSRKRFVTFGGSRGEERLIPTSPVQRSHAARLLLWSPGAGRSAGQILRSCSPRRGGWRSFKPGGCPGRAPATHHRSRRALDRSTEPLTAARVGGGCGPRADDQGAIHTIVHGCAPRSTPDRRGKR
jgi:hypothetical protein